MRVKFINKILKRILAVFLAIIGLLLIAYLLFIYNAEILIKEFVSMNSKGKLQLEIKKVSFSPRALRLTLEKPHFMSTDSLNQSSTFDVSVDKIFLELAAIKPLIFHKKLFIDSVILMRPVITITKWKEAKSEKFSLPEQMGKTYQSLNATLDKLSINYCLIDSGAFTLIDKVHPGSKPVSITDYYFSIDNLNKKSEINNQSSRFMYADRIRFYSSHQNIVFSNGNQQIKYGRLRINSRNKSIELDSCYIFSKKENADFNSFSGYFDTLRFTNVDFLKLTQSNIMDADSVYCINPAINLKTTIKQKSDKSKSLKGSISKDSLISVVKQLMGNIDVDFVGVFNASISLFTKNGDKITPYNIKRTDFTMHNVAIINDPNIPINVGRFDLGLKEYKASDPDSNYLVKFDSIHLMNEKLYLSNFSITPTLNNTKKDDVKNISMASLAIKDISWLELLTTKKMVASEIELIQPVINITAPTNIKSNSIKKKKDIFQTINTISQSVDIKKLSVLNASVNYLSGGITVAHLENVNSSIGINELLKSASIKDLVNSSLYLDFSKGIFNLKGNQIYLQDAKITGVNHSVALKSLIYKNENKNISLTFNQVGLKNISFSDSKQLNVGNLNWKSGSIIKGKHIAVVKGIDTTSKLKIVIDNLEGNNTTLKFLSEKNKIKTQLSLVKSDKIIWDGNNAPAINNLLINGEYLNFSKSGLLLEINEFDIDDHKRSNLQNVSLVSSQGKDSIKINVTSILFTPDINSILKSNSVIDNIEINDPEINIVPNPGYITLNKTRAQIKFPQLLVNKLSINNPTLNGLKFSENNQVDFKRIKSNIIINKIESLQSGLTAKDIEVSLNDIRAKTPKLNIELPQEGNLQIKLNLVKLTPDPKATGILWETNLELLQAKSLFLETQKTDSTNTKISFSNIELRNLSFNNKNKISLSNILHDNKNLQLLNTGFKIANNISNIKVDNLSYTTLGQDIKFDSLSILPVLNREEFMKSKLWQTDYPVLNFHATTISGFDTDLYFSDTVLHIQKIVTENPVVEIYKDRRLPFKNGVIKPLPVTLLRQLNSKINIEQLELKDANITYEEFNNKTDKSGRVNFSSLHAKIQNITNYNLTPIDSLKLNASGMFMDSASIRFMFAESYTDSLNAFTYGLRFRPFKMSSLNPILEPLISAKIKSGQLDTVRLNAIGRENVSHGKMKMYYSNLRIQYLNKGSDSIKTFKTKLITFLANEILINRNKKRGYGAVYTERNKERSFINYWLKIALSGVKSSTGVKTNNKVEKSYKRRIKKINVPEIPDVNL
jgi:hypothetical protein